MRRRWAVRWGDTSVGPRQRKQSMPLGTIESSLSGISEARCVILVSDGVSCCAVVDFALLRAVRVAPSATELVSGPAAFLWAPIIAQSCGDPPPPG